MSATVWITGAAGFSGRHLAAYLASLPEKPRTIGLDLQTAPPAGLDGYESVDLLNEAALSELARKHQPTHVVHLAAVMPPGDESLMWSVNVGGTLRLLQALNAAGCRNTRVVSIGSASEYRPPWDGPLSESHACGGSSPYGATKCVQTLLALQAGRELGLQVMVARTFNISGPKLSNRLAPGWLCEQFAQPVPPQEITLGNLESARDFTDIRDVVAAYWAVVRQGQPGEVYNVCTGIATSVREMVETLCQITGLRPTLRVDPARVRGNDLPICVGDNRKLMQATNWRPRITLRESLTDMLRAIKQT